MVNTLAVIFMWLTYLSYSLMNCYKTVSTDIVCSQKYKGLIGNNLFLLFLSLMPIIQIMQQPVTFPLLMFFDVIFNFNFKPLLC